MKDFSVSSLLKSGSTQLTHATSNQKMSTIMTPSFKFGLHTRRKSQPEIKTNLFLK